MWVARAAASVAVAGRAHSASALSSSTRWPTPAAAPAAAFAQMRPTHATHKAEATPAPGAPAASVASVVSPSSLPAPGPAALEAAARSLTGAAVFAQPLIKSVPRPMSLRTWQSTSQTPTERADAADHRFSLTKKNVRVHQWTVGQNVELITLIHRKARALLRAHQEEYERAQKDPAAAALQADQPAPYDVAAFPVLPPVFAEWAREEAEMAAKAAASTTSNVDPSSATASSSSASSSTSADASSLDLLAPGNKKARSDDRARAQRSKIDRQRKAEIVTFAQHLRATMEGIPLLTDRLYELVNTWIRECPGECTARRTREAVRIHWDIMSDPRTKATSGEATGSVVPVDAEGNPIDLATLKRDLQVQYAVGGGPMRAIPRIRSILRYIFFHKLPKGEGTWLDVARHAEAMAFNWAEIKLAKEGAPEHALAMQILEADSKVESYGHRRRAQLRPLSEPIVGYTIWQQLQMQAARQQQVQQQPPAPEGGVDSLMNSPGSLLHPDTLVRPLACSLDLAAPEPAPYRLPLVHAQGRAQGFTYERSIRATLAQYPEFTVLKKNRVTILPRLVPEEGRLPAMSRTTAVYGLNLPLYSQLVREERDWREYVGQSEARKDETARRRRAKYHTVVGTGKAHNSQRMKRILEAKQAEAAQAQQQQQPADDQEDQPATAPSATTTTH